LRVFTFNAAESDIKNCQGSRGPGILVLSKPT
jgi:hypothetical protein